MRRNAISVMFFLIVMAHPAWSQMIAGVVFSVADQEIEILVPSDKTIEIGTPVELWAKTADGSEVSVGTWTISRCEICLAYARAAEPTGTPKMGQKALIGRPSEPAPPVQPVPPIQPVPLVASPPQNVPGKPFEGTPASNSAPGSPAQPDPVSPKPMVSNPQEVVTPPVAPQPQTPVKAAPEIKLSASDQRLMADLTSNQATRIRDAAKYLYRGRYESPTLMDQAAQVLQEQYNKSTTDRYQLDAMAWICKALWASGKAKYIDGLETVEKNATSVKLRKYAAKYGQSLRQKSGRR